MIVNKFNKAAILLILIFTYSHNVLAAGADDFILQVETDLHVNVPITSDDSSFTIRTKPGETYNYNVDCNNDGNFEVTNRTGDYTCIYQGPDEKIIRIEDNVGDGTGFPQIYFNNQGDKRKINDIVQWGTGKWISMAGAFRGADGLEVSATDVPDLTLVTNLSNMFAFASKANPDTSMWNVSGVINFSGMFEEANLANPDVSQWNTSNAINMSAMFCFAGSANPDVSQWNTSNVTNMAAMFYGAATATPDISQWNTSNVTNMVDMFSLVSNLVNLNLSGWDITGITTPNSMQGMFLGSTLSISAYDSALNNFDSQVSASGIIFDGGNSKYCNVAARDNLINAHGWTITDGGLDSMCGNDIIFKNSFEIPVTMFSASEKRFVFDFSLLDNIKLDTYPELIAIGLDNDHEKVIKTHIRKSATQLQIRMSHFYQYEFDEGNWIFGEWKDIYNDKLTTVSW